MAQKENPHQFDDPTYVDQWAQEANRKRPHRQDVFQWMVEAINTAGTFLRVLELGSGPGFLAEYLLSHSAIHHYVLWDSSSPMQELAKKRLKSFSAVVEKITVSFEEQEQWVAFGPSFDSIVALQSVHELRDKDKIAELYRRICGALKPGGLFLVADHSRDGNKAGPIFTDVEQIRVLKESGFMKALQGPTYGDLMTLKAQKAQ